MGTRHVVYAPLAWLGEGPVIEDAAVVADAGRVVYAGPATGAPGDGDGLEGNWFLMPAVFDRHVHIGLSDPAAVLRGGVTKVRDLGWPPPDVFPLADLSDGPAFEGPRIGAVGPMITARRGYPTRAGWAPAGTALEVRGADEAGSAAERILALGAVGLKVALNADAGPVLSDEELAAVCAVGRDAALPVVAHAQGAGQVERALAAGVTQLAHTPWTEWLRDDLVEAMAGASMRIVSTLDIQSYGRTTPELMVAMDNLQRFLAAGGKVLYGTDLGNGPIPAGIDAREARLLADAGMSKAQVLAAMIGGRLQPGAQADFVCLEGDPFEDLSALERVRVVARGGRLVHAETPR